MERPDVIRLVNYVRIPREAHRRKITRRAVLARDSWTCQYCGSTKSGLTVDHVIPRSRGGKSVWENIVAACATCNRRKGNRLPREIQMHPPRRPEGAAGRRSSSRSPARRSRRPGSSTYRRPRREGRYDSCAGSAGSSGESEASGEFEPSGSGAVVSEDGLT